MANDTIISRTW